MPKPSTPPPAPTPCIRPDCPLFDCVYHCQGFGCGKTVKEGHDHRCPVLRAMPPCVTCRGLGRDKNNVPCLLCDGCGRWGSREVRETPPAKERVKKERPAKVGRVKAAGVDALF